MRNRITQLATVERAARPFVVEAGKLNWTAAETARAQRERRRFGLVVLYRGRRATTG